MAFKIRSSWLSYHVGFQKESCTITAWPWLKTKQLYNYSLARPAKHKAAVQLQAQAGFQKRNSWLSCQAGYLILSHRFDCVFTRICSTHGVKLQMHPNFMLKTSSSWFDCGFTHQIRYTLSMQTTGMCRYTKTCLSCPNHPVMIVEAKCARGNVLLCRLSRRVITSYILRIGF